MKQFLLFLGLLIFLTGHWSCQQSQNDTLILGTWQVEEYWNDQGKMTSDRIIRFYSDGTYDTFESAGDTISGEWRFRYETLVLYQPELKDMHGNRLMEPFTRVWKTVVSEEWMMLDGTNRSNSAGMRLILKKQNSLNSSR